MAMARSILAKRMSTHTRRRWTSQSARFCTQKVASVGRMLVTGGVSSTSDVFRADTSGFRPRASRWNKTQREQRDAATVAMDGPSTAHAAMVCKVSACGSRSARHSALHAVLLETRRRRCGMAGFWMHHWRLTFTQGTKRVCTSANEGTPAEPPGRNRSADAKSSTHRFIARCSGWAVPEFQAWMAGLSLFSFRSHRHVPSELLPTCSGSRILCAWNVHCSRADVYPARPRTPSQRARRTWLTIMDAPISLPEHPHVAAYRPP
mmetsp:Transcript_11545/g.70967  ORF Transcript_11545/g.70967 Transcript_11545/m.70967 type:complete len:263 (-) Transcript_11545:1068-1856(-)